MNPALIDFIQDCLTEITYIPEDRKQILLTVALFLEEKIKKGEEVNVLYVCTHNSRRSHFGQIWGKTAAHYFGFENVHTFSAGTEVTAFNPNAIQAISSIGFEVKSNGAATNLVYDVLFDPAEKPIQCFSKTYQDGSIPKNNVVAIMTCTEADGNCPVIPGTALRVACPYQDPKLFDGTDQQESAYLERCRQIAIESLFLFSNISKA